jgi:hypothetical protein
MLRRENIKVELVGNKKLKDYAGMNPEAGKVLGFPIKKNTILIDKNLTKTQKRRTILHELEEMKDMKKGEKYWTAHKKALIKEEET